ncbi:MAG: hypothetical protein US25_C0048G0004 [Candidatus Moranbacteria bacterium GW2011_GWE1_36_7]|nr:MAG: hypothetical protein UR99_C0015G0033 [Candidatus Moranbacteria bacterium GW2011_GWD2_36_12]KKQ06399.1 MAG: hypothetical protein US16_C0018G0033 [Candidatus Moranbacteria bacterium GW2011_GWE2_36_40]KKQ12580.1 MAG: hypothetical protein US25_C0048G0004 [Candidatus Moranbacteria bacterium GW2011_GWE1_36_7]
MATQLDPANFSIRTMQDDLLQKQTNSAPKTSSLEEKLPITQNNIGSLAPQPAAEFSTNDSSSPFETKEENIIRQESAVENIEEPATEMLSEEKKPLIFKIILSIIFILTVSAIGVGGYYFWSTKSSQQITETPQPIELPVEEIPATSTPEPVATEEPIAQPEKFSKDKSNFIVFDLITIDAKGISQTIKSLSEEIATLTEENQQKNLYEFIAVDANNNPIAFQIFATAAELTFSQSILNSLAPEFSLFIYNDNGKMRTAISTTISNKDLFNKEIVAQEKTFSKNITPLFLGEKIENKNIPFSDGEYAGHKTKYTNLNQEKNISIDYLSENTFFIFATSKETLRAVIDKKIISTNDTAQENTDSGKILPLEITN